MNKVTAHKSLCLITMNENNDVLNNGHVIVADNGMVVDVCTQEEVSTKYPGCQIIDHGNSIIMPGLINTHSHSGLLRGTAEYLPLWDWLETYIDPMHKVLDEEDAEAAAFLCYAEQLLCGITTTVDMWRFMHTAAEACATLGNRLIIVPYLGDHKNYSYFDTFDQNEKLIKTYHESCAGRIQVWVGLEHFLYGTKESYNKISHLCNEYDTGFHTHSNETISDVRYIQDSYGDDPIVLLMKYGLLSVKKTLLAHCVWLSDTEVKILADFNVGVAHNPISNMKLASGAANIPKLIRSGIAVGIGTDGEKENNNLDLFDSVKVASLLAKHSSKDPGIIDHWELMKSLTINGAKALGMEKHIGSIEVGKIADFIVINANSIHLTPLFINKHFNIHHNIIHSVKGSDVCCVYVNGKCVVNNGELVNASLDDIRAIANRRGLALLDKISAYSNNGEIVNRMKIIDDNASTSLGSK